ncbi:MAG: YceI family protein [Xanthomonadales bacterium]|nr:YceI family protein [Xanthomonadales bacterium]
MFATSCLAGLIALAATSPAENPLSSETLTLDPAKSSAAFSVKVLWMFAVDGRFGNVRGTVGIDRFRGQAMVDAHINAAEVTMHRESALAWVKSAEFFDVDRHPEIHFHSDAFPLTRLHLGGQVPGQLTMRGITRDVTFEVLPSACEKPAVECAIEAVGTVRRSEFGMTTRRTTLADKVELSFSVRITGAPRSPAGS